MIKLVVFLIIFFTGFQFYAFNADKLIGAIGLEGLRQVLFLYIFTLLLLSILVIKKNLIIRKNIFIGPLFLFWLYAFIRVINSPGYFYGLTEIVKFSYVILSLIIFDQFFYLNRSSQNFIDKTIKLTFVVFCIGVAINLLSGWTISPDTGEFLLGGLGGRALGAMFSSIVSVYFITKYFFTKKISYFLLFVVGCLFLMLNFTRIVIVAFVLALIIIALWLRKFKLMLLFAIIPIIIILLFPSYITLVVKESFRGIEDISGLRNLSLTEIPYYIKFTGREILWYEAITGFVKNPILGNGTGYSNLSVKLITNGIEQVHNDYLKILCDMGIIGLILYLSIYISMLKKSVRIYLADKVNSRQAYILFIITMLQIIIFSITDNVISYAPYILTYLFLFYVNLTHSSYSFKQR